MEPNAKSNPNPLLAHLNDQDEAHDSTRVDFLHPGTVVQPMVAKPKIEPKSADTPVSTPAEAQAPAEPPKAPEPPAESPPPPTVPSAPPSPHNRRPIIVAVIVVVILALLGGGAYWYLKIYRPDHQAAEKPNNSAVQPVNVTPQKPTSLDQKDSTGKSVGIGGNVKAPIELDVTLSTSATSGSLKAQVEVEPVGTAFTGTANYTGEEASVSGGSLAAKVNVTDLKDGSYHWQGRLTDGTNNSDWAAFGSNDETATDFVIDATAPTAAHITSVAGKKLATGASSTSTTQNQPTISGTAEAGASISLAIAPDSQTVTATADSSGNWTATPSTALANGDHTITITTTDTAGNTSTASFTLSINTATAAPATTQIAPTGDNTKTLTLIGIVLVALSGAGLILVNRRGQSQV